MSQKQLSIKFSKKIGLKSLNILPCTRTIILLPLQIIKKKIPILTFFQITFIYPPHQVTHYSTVILSFDFLEFFANNFRQNIIAMNSGFTVTKGEGVWNGFIVHGLISIKLTLIGHEKCGITSQQYPSN